MLKFFQKYNKIILVAGGSLLMVVFLLPNVQMFMPDPADRVIGRVAGRELTERDRMAAARELELLGRMAPVPDDATAWLLLMEEARGNGIYASRAEARAALRQLRSQDGRVGQMLSQLGAPEGLLVRSVRHLLMFRELSGMIVSAAAEHPSAPRLRHFAQAIRARAAVDMVAIDADFLAGDAPAPDEQTLREHFQRYREVRAGESEPYGFGYFLPPRVRLEYVAVPLDRVAASVEVSEVEAHRYYLEHPERFLPPEQPGEGNTPADANTEEPTRSGGENPSPEGAAADGEAAASEDGPQPYEQVRQRVFKILRQRKAEQEQQQIVRWMVGELNAELRRLPTDREGYRQLGEGAQTQSLEALAREAERQFGVRPNVVRMENRWLTAERIAGLEGFGGASLQSRGESIPVADYIASTRELGQPDEPALAALRLQAGVASKPVENPAGDAYIFRILDAQRAHAPESLDEVRESVVRDVKRLQAYQRLKNRTGEMLEQAKSAGLEGLAQSYRSRVRRLDPFSRRDYITMLMEGRLATPDLPVVGRSEAFVDAVFDTARRVEEAGGLAGAKEELKMGTAAVDARQLLAVYKLTDYQPVDRATYRSIKPQLPRLMATGSLAPGMRDAGEANPLSREAVAARIGFEAVESGGPGNAGDRAGGDQPQGPSPLLR